MDLTKIKALVELLQQSRLSALELSEDGGSLRLERHAQATVSRLPAQTPGEPADHDQVVTPGGMPPAPSLITPVASDHVVKASMQGILHLTPAPGEPAFVRVGDRVQLEQVICVIEAMKMFNTIETEVAGTVVEILAEAARSCRRGQLVPVRRKSDASHFIYFTNLHAKE
eukprot:gene27327-30183_t